MGNYHTAAMSYICILIVCIEVVEWCRLCI